ncbi:MAG: SDR family NAD(P)-dependent oxidoreductase [Deltaproteobacteria bacterium]|nr:MAG: SDR family NAD(P)-dependent oxidoreductase [Deltaproteobacteria bacterium]
MNRTRVLIVGGGFAGLAVAHYLREAGIEDFAILEKGSTLGGTWRDNRYPGCACDVPSQLYSLSFALNTEWSRVFAEAPEIHRYMLAVADDMRIEPHVHLDTEVLEARWDDASAEWEVRTSQGLWRAPVLVAGTGPLHEPNLPNFDGLDRFEGEAFHTARWPEGLDLRGRRVAVVGTGSTSIQLVPEIQPLVDQLVLFQRTPGWVIPKPDHAIPWVERAAFRYVPGFQRGYRAAWYLGLELLQRSERQNRTGRLRDAAEAHIARHIDDPALRARLTPEWAFGCKRLLMSNSYYPALAQDNVTVTSAVTRITRTGVVDADGVEHPVDTLILATGFEVHDPPIAHRVVGRTGQSLSEAWNGSPTAYLGTTVPGFPNLFLPLGPNTGNGHTSVLVILEAQARYIADGVRQMDEQGWAAVEVTERAHDRWNDEVQQALGPSVWNSGGCGSWYLDKQGKNRAIYPWSTLDARRRLRRFDPSVYTARGASQGPIAVVTGGAHGIGLAIAEGFANEGCRVVIADLDLDRAKVEAARLGGVARSVDVTDAEAMHALVADIEDSLGPIEVWVNNAGVAATGRFLDESRAAEAANLGVNYFGVSNGLKAVLPAMQARGRGHVVNIASLAGRVPVAGLASYVASKHAVVGLSASLRQELEGTGVTLTTILPTVVRTRLAAAFPHRRTLAVDPEDVAREVVRSWHHYEAEIAVPRVLGPLSRVQQVLPERLAKQVRKLIDGDRILTSADDAVRAAYERTFLGPRRAG